MSRAYDSVRSFEQAMCEYTGARYAVAVESCSAALFLSCLYLKVKSYDEIIVPKYTYPSVAASIVNAGGRIKFEDIEWQDKGYYELSPIGIIDSAKMLSRNMYINVGSAPFVCISFHVRKSLPIGRGGMILTYFDDACEWLRCARHDGRHDREVLEDDVLEMPGWNMTMTPEQAARGLCLMENLKDENILPRDPYQDLSQYKFFTEANR